jgi:hypothetical protein
MLPSATQLHAGPRLYPTEAHSPQPPADRQLATLPCHPRDLDYCMTCRCESCKQTLVDLRHGNYYVHALMDEATGGSLFNWLARHQDHWKALPQVRLPALAALPTVSSLLASCWMPAASLLLPAPTCSIACPRATVPGLLQTPAGMLSSQQRTQACAPCHTPLCCCLLLSPLLPC